jgi:hypothetical protein
MKLRAHHNVIPLDEERRVREQQRAVDEAVIFVDWTTTTSAPSHPAAQALLAGIMQGIGEREKDEALLDAGRRLGEAATRKPVDAAPAAPRGRWRAQWLRSMLWGC